MGLIYAYSPTATDCRSIGLCGALMPTSCEFEQNAGEFGEVTIEHPMDDYGKYRCLQDGVILKMPIPVRVVPALKTDSSAAAGCSYVPTVYKYYVKYASSGNQRTIYKSWNHADNKLGKAIYTIGVVTAPNPRAQVVVTEIPYDEDDSYVKVQYTYTKKGKNVTVGGWMIKSALDEIAETINIPQTSSGLEYAVPSYAVKPQLFRIYEVTPASDEGGKVTVRARRIIYDLLGNLTDYKSTTAVKCYDVCKGILSKTLADHDFTVYTDIADTHIGFDYRDMNPIEALIDPEKGVTARYGAEIVCDDYDIYVLRHAGLDNGVKICYRKNLIGIDCKTDTSECATAIRPRGESANGEHLYLDGHEDANGHGYNWNGSTCADHLPSGYHFKTNSGGVIVDGTTIYKDSLLNAYAIPKIYSLEADDAKAQNKKGEYYSADVRRTLATQAIAEFENGCGTPDVTLNVDFVMLGDTSEYADYKHLENLFVYDMVHVSHEPLGISANIQLTSFKWDCVAERVTEATFGSLEDSSASVTSWQISGVDGGKISVGSISSMTLQDDVINARHVTANSINANAIQAEAMTTEKLATGIVSAVQAEINTLTADMVDSHEIDTDTINAALAAFEYVKASSFNATEASIKLMIAETGITEQATINKLYAQYLQVQNLLAANATFGRVVIKGTDGNYYRVNIDSSGTITTTQVTVSSTEIEDGYTSTTRTDGLEKRQIIEDTAIYQQLSTRDFKAANGIIDELRTVNIHTDTLFAREATITHLKAATVTSRDGNPLYFGDLVNDYRDGMLLGRDQASQVVYVDIGQLSAGNKARISQDGFKVIVQGQTYSHLGSNFVQFGNYQIRKSADGGMVFKLKEGV